MMKYNKILKNNETNKNTFLVACVSSIVLLLTMCYFGINTNVKGTYSAETYTVTFYPNGGTLQSSGEIECTPTNGACRIEAADTPTVVRYEYTFNGWTSTEDCPSGVGSTGALTVYGDDAKMYACWKKTTKCYFCSGDNTFQWDPSSTSGCDMRFSYTTQDACLAQNYACYACPDENNEINYVYGQVETYSTSKVCKQTGGYNLGKANCTANKITLSQKNLSVVKGEKGGFTVSSDVAGTFNIKSGVTSVVSVSPDSIGVSANETKEITVSGLVAGSGISVVVTFTPTDTSRYITITETVKVTVEGEKCWQCNDPNNIYEWSLYNPGVTDDCGSNWHEINRTEAECKNTETGDRKLMYSGDTVKCYESANTSSDVVKSWNAGDLCIGLYVTNYTDDWLRSTTYNCYVDKAKFSDNKPSSCTSSGDGGTVSETKFTATFNPNGGTLKGDKTKECKTTSKTCKINNLPTASKDGYTFTGWGDKSSCTLGNGDELTLSSNATFYACYTKNAGSTNTDKDGNTTTNPGTGDIVIALVWFMGIFAVAYSVYYFRQIKQN